MRIDDIPRLSMSSLVNRLKAVSSHHSWKRHYDYLQTQFWKEKTFWSDGYFVGSIGDASPETIPQYIKTQGGMVTHSIRYC